MTLVMAWRTTTGLTIAADTRLTDARGQLTDMAPKIFEVPIEVEGLPQPGQVHQFPAIGFAYAGNSLVAQSAHAIMSAYLRNLGSSAPDRAPSVASVATLFSKAVHELVRERGSLRPKDPPSIELIVFGFCEFEGDVTVHYISARASPAGIVVEGPDRIAIPTGRIIYFGSGSSAASARLSGYTQLDAPSTIRPHDVLRSVISDSAEEGVGGHLQFALVNERGARLLSEMKISLSGEAVCTVLGCDVASLGILEGFTPPMGGVVSFDERSDASLELT